MMEVVKRYKGERRRYYSGGYTSLHEVVVRVAGLKVAQHFSAGKVQYKK